MDCRSFYFSNTDESAKSGKSVNTKYPRYSKYRIFTTKKIPMTKQKIVVLSGAGISAESGIKTFRDADGLWEGHDVMEVASPEGYRKNPAMVLEFYNQRRRQLKEVSPNKGHLALVSLEDYYDVVIITQNVDDLHEKAGSNTVIHLHGELKKVRSTRNESIVLAWEDDLNLGDVGPDGEQLRPHIVWFGEMVPMIEVAAEEIMTADFLIVVGTSLQVYPAAGLIDYTPKGCEIYLVDPKPNISWELSKRSLMLEVIQKNGTQGLQEVANILIDRAEHKIGTT